ncbi:hypothetical protein BS17DRAFT_216847 [Gyrodon lividus]|nr:hypothetical protein BS17DRAFT_216847 [Gyrodon lividus]
MRPGSSSSERSSWPVRWVCICQKFSFGRSHEVSTTTFYEHLEQAAPGLSCSSSSSPSEPSSGLIEEI